MPLLSIPTQNQTKGGSEGRSLCWSSLSQQQRRRETGFAAARFGGLGGLEGWGSGGRLLCIVRRRRVSRGCIGRLVAGGIAVGFAAAVVVVAAAVGEEEEREVPVVVVGTVVVVVAVAAAAAAAAAAASAPRPTAAPGPAKCVVEEEEGEGEEEGEERLAAEEEEAQAWQEQRGEEDPAAA